MSVSPEHLDAVCEGCLSPDRQLISEITDLAIKKVFYEILNEAVQANIDSGTLRLCTECVASIQRFLAFKQQVREATETLNRHLLKSSKYNVAQISSATAIPGVTHTSSCHEARHQPLAFIKIEDAADDGDDYYVDEAYSQDVEDKHLTTVLKSDLVKPNKLKLKVRNKKKTEDEFDASDDEPLNKKKRADSGRGAAGNKCKKEKREKKENDSGPKLDRRKFPAPKKEKPAGVVDNARVRNKLQQLGVPPGLLQMVVLSWAEVEAERESSRASSSYTRHRHQCARCVLGFNHRVKLDNHMRKHEPSMGSHECSVCTVRCKDAHALAAHRRRHRVRWRCCACGGTWSRADVAADHASRAHGAPPPSHTCRVCGHCELSLGKLRNHMKNHGERQKCELCGKTFRDRTSLRTHLFIHGGEKEYSCARCDKRFLFKKAMEVHLVTHDAPAHLYCYQCDMNFKNMMSYRQHMKYSLKHIDPDKLKFACEECDKRFTKASRLQEHRAALHLRLAPVACAAPGCGFACASRAVLRTHARMVHRGGRALRNHVCHACGKTYMTKKTLEGHLRSHSGERPFQCRACPSTFGYEAALYNHNKLVHLKPKLGRSRPPPQSAPPLPPAPEHLPQTTETAH